MTGITTQTGKILGFHGKEGANVVILGCDAM
jgi:hypothetical protein